ncbi:MAG: CubicO group peptidase (beta-lactamase class C family) [Bacteroidia bacterium]|jgi:CubicO group peptidase (beta-lactamase class C family)
MRILIALLLVCAGNFSFAQSKASRIDSLLTDCHNRGIFNGVALVVNDGEEILTKGYGLADLENSIPLKPEHQFYIGSITKQFTSMLIFQLHEAKKLDIHAPISTYLEEFAEEIYQDISVYHLLTHRSGIPSYTGFKEFDKASNFTQAQMVDMIIRPLEFEPGSKFSYSNSGYFLLGLIAERISGKDFGTLLSDKIFAPLEMNASGFSTTWLDNEHAKGYRKTVDGLAPMPDYSAQTLFSTGGIYSNVLDLRKWDEALYTNQLLSDSLKRIMFTPILSDYACGWRVHKGVKEDGTISERHQHGGTIQGYHSYILRRIPQKQTVILLDNNFDQEIQEIKNAIWRILADAQERPIKSKLSNLLLQAAETKQLPKTIKAIGDSLEAFQETYDFEEFDINTVGYRLMENGRYTEAKSLFQFNIDQYPNAWNVYDSMGELQLKMGFESKSKEYYQKAESLKAKKD